MGSWESSSGLRLDGRVTERSAGPAVNDAEDTSAFQGSVMERVRLEEGLGSSQTSALARPSENVERTWGARPSEAKNGMAGTDIRNAHKTAINGTRLRIVLHLL